MHRWRKAIDEDANTWEDSCTRKSYWMTCSTWVRNSSWFVAGRRRCGAPIPLLSAVSCCAARQTFKGSGRTGRCSSFVFRCTFSDLTALLPLITCFELFETPLTPRWFTYPQMCFIELLIRNANWEIMGKASLVFPSWFRLFMWKAFPLVITSRNWITAYSSYGFVIGITVCRLSIWLKVSI